MLNGNEKNRNIRLTPYNSTTTCPRKNSRNCRNGCPDGKLVCMHRGRFHNALAQLGKTNLTKEERTLLGPNDPDGGNNLDNLKVRNPIFLYEQSMMNEEYMWEDLTAYLGANETIPHDRRVSSHGQNRSKSINLCDGQYDNFRAMMMPIAYNVSVWLQEYFVPIAQDVNQ